MSDTSFGEREFALGTIVGYRSFYVSEAGVLKSPSHRMDWMPGVNHAECKSNGYTKIEAIEGESYDDNRRRREEWVKNHEMLECEHGFYAYYSPTERFVDDRPYVHAVIEGFGETLVGTKGFRCMKARILAVSIEPWNGWEMQDHMVRRIKANYPGVAFFESALAMGYEFPATQMEEANG